MPMVRATIPREEEGVEMVGDDCPRRMRLEGVMVVILVLPRRG